MFKILIVANDEPLGYTLELILQDARIETHHLSERECVLEKCRTTDFSLVIFTQLAPYFTSMNIVEHLRAELRSMPKIFVVDFSHSQSTVLTLLECGVDQYITLPVNIYRLREKVLSQVVGEGVRC